MSIPSSPSPAIVHLSGTSIEDPIFNNVDAQAKKEILSGWQTLLNQAANQEPERPRLYIVLDGSDLKLTENPTENQKKLRITDIIKISTECIYAERGMVFSREVEAENCIEYTDNVSRLTEGLITQRKEKYANNRFRNVMRKLAGATSFLLIGLPFYLAIKNEDKKFESEIQEMRRALTSGGKTAKFADDYDRPHFR